MTVLLPAAPDRVVVTDDGAELAVTDIGAGPPVVLIHGWTEQREVWVPVAERLVAAGRRVVLYDQRGHGSSTAGTDGFTLARLAADLRSVLEATDVRDAVLAGHSMGGMAVLALAADAPLVLTRRAAALVLVATGAHGIGRTRLDAPLGRLLDQPWFISLFRGPLGPLLVRRTIGRHPRRDHLRLTADLFAACTPEARRGFAEAMRTMDLRAVLPSIDRPTVVLVGTLDRLAPPRHADALVAGIPGARLVSLPDRGHQLPLEATEQVAATVRSLP